MELRENRPERDLLPHHLEQSVEAIAQIHRRYEDDVSIHQRWIERATGRIGRPATTYLIFALACIWVAVNLALGRRAPDPPPFARMQGLVSFCALLMTTIILTTESRLSRIEERRARLSLQMATLAEAKVSKLVELVERLRSDSPLVENRADPQAQAMVEASDPQRVLEVIEQRHEAGDRA
jgi:uncharacterized membrane protein